MAWQQPGGDWVDAEGTPYGNDPYATAEVPMARGRQTVSWDVTRLVRDWPTHTGQAGALLLRANSGGNSGAVNFNSRESKDASARPELVIEWADGSKSRSNAIADSHLPCSTHKSVGAKPVFQIANGTNALLAFPFDEKETRSIARAELLLSTDKVYHRPASIGVYRPNLPQTQAQGPQQGIAAAYRADKGIERNPEVLFADRFEVSDWMTRWSSYNKNSTTEVVADDADNRFERLDGKALKVTVQKGKVLGLTAHYRFDQRPEGEPEAMYFRYYLRFGENWNPTLEGGKLPGFSGTYNRGGWGGRKSNGTNGWSARGTFFRWRDHDSPLNNRRGIGSYVYYADMPAIYGSTWGWNEGPTGMLEKNHWYCVEQYVRMNTPGKKDGVLRAWIDGQLAFEKVDMRYRDVPDLKIESLWMNVYHGGTTPAGEDLTLYIDNLVIARQYIGPARLSN
jgi:hypothetical protein